ncbi:hypothetical protein RJT34_13746 [Clitoria ternatea]|uniref:Uncharacterized protein n=1 Tax=Clitoria ternatea TaxID=43366 RepID=A0AAN9JR97_CLITE
MHTRVKLLRKKRKSLTEALEKIKLECDLLPKGVGETLLPCSSMIFYYSEEEKCEEQVCLLRQFYKSVSKVDYYTLRHGFITVLLLVGTKLQGVICAWIVMTRPIWSETLLVRPNDHFFWFGWPKLLLHLNSFILFQYGSDSTSDHAFILKLRVSSEG